MFPSWDKLVEIFSVPNIWHSEAKQQSIRNSSEKTTLLQYWVKNFSAVQTHPLDTSEASTLMGHG
jgi:hypothetical protein